MKPAPRLDIHQFNWRDPLKTTRLIGCVCKRREALSLAVLIGRKLDHFKGLLSLNALFSFEGAEKKEVQLVLLFLYY